jgi:hypothetical protein
MRWRLVAATVVRRPRWEIVERDHVRSNSAVVVAHPAGIAGPRRVVHRYAVLRTQSADRRGVGHRPTEVLPVVGDEQHRVAVEVGPWLEVRLDAASRAGEGEQGRAVERRYLTPPTSSRRPGGSATPPCAVAPRPCRCLGRGAAGRSWPVTAEPRSKSLREAHPSPTSSCVRTPSDATDGASGGRRARGRLGRAVVERSCLVRTVLDELDEDTARSSGVDERDPVTTATRAR